MAFGLKKKDKNEEEEKKLVSKVQVMYRNSYNDKLSRCSDWDNYYKAYTGEYFQKKLPSYKNQVVENFVFSTIETVKPVMLSENPKIIALPQSPDKLDKADAVQQALTYEWSRTKMMPKTGNVITNCLVYGTGILGILWDKKSENGLGNVKPLNISPFNFFIDPNATTIDDAEYCGFAIYKSLGEVAKLNKKKVEQLKASLSMPTDEWLNYGKDGSSETSSPKKLLYIEIYFRDDSTMIGEDEETGEEVEILKYPKGRKVCIAGDVLLYDGENEYKDGKFPFAILKCYDIPGEFWGMGEVQQIMAPTNTVNVLTNSLVETAELTSNPIWILDKNSGVTKGSLTNRKGLVVRKNPGTEVKRDAPPTMPAYIQNVIDNMKQDIENISGVFDVTRGEKPTGITAAAAIQALNEQAQGRIKLKVQNLEQFLSEVGGLWLSRIQQFWASARIIRVMQDDYKPSFTTLSGDEVDGDFDIIIAAGSTMPENKTSKLQQMIQLAQTQAEDGLPLVDRQTVLENADMPGIQKILQRFQQNQQLQSQGSQSQEQAQLQTQLQIIQAKAQADIQVLQAKAQADAQVQTQQNNMAHEAKLQQMAAQHEADMQTAQVQHEQQLAQNQQNSMPHKEVAKMLTQLPADVMMQIAQNNPRMLEILNQVNNQQSQEPQMPMAMGQ
jgi:hypothetical protein